MNFKFETWSDIDYKDNWLENFTYSINPYYSNSNYYFRNSIVWLESKLGDKIICLHKGKKYYMNFSKLEMNKYFYNLSIARQILIVNLLYSLEPSYYVIAITLFTYFCLFPNTLIIVEYNGDLIINGDNVFTGKIKID